VTTEVLRGRAASAARERDELRDEVHSLRAEAREDAWHMVDPAKRLRESAIRDGRFHDFQDANVLVARIERLARRGGK
jgi:hypothetical protein